LINEHHSKLEALISEDDIIKKCIVKTLQEDWTALKHELFEKLEMSIEKQIKAVLRTESWHTKY